MIQNVDIDFKENKLNCALSLNESNSDQNFFDWTIIGIGNGLFHPYDTLELKNYMDSFNDDIPDPLRTLVKLNHLIPRVNLFAKILNDGIVTRKKEITTGLKIDIINRSVNGLKVMEKEKCLINLSDIIDLSKIFFKGIDAYKGEDIIKEKNYKKGVIIFRNSSTSDSEKDYSIFSATHCKGDSCFSNFRFANIHGVGIYKIANLSSEKVNSLKTSKDFLDFVNWKQPDYCFFLDLLCELLNDNYTLILNE